MIPASDRWRNLGVAAGGATAVLFAAFDLYQWIAEYAANHFHNDFTFYFAAARIGLGHGWSSIYDLKLQQAELNAMGSGIIIAELARYISPPPVAWLATPFTALPYPIAYWSWSVLLVAALVGCWLWATPGVGRLRVLYLLAAVGWLPVIYGLQLGQPGLIVAAGVAGSYALLRANHQWWAGVALGVLALKPQLAFLLPIALLAARQSRAFAGTAVTLGALVALSAVALGPSGVGAYLERLNFASSVAVNRELTLAYVVGDAARPLQIFIATWTMLLVYRLRNHRVELVYATALVGGMLASPYMHLDDFAMLGLAGWLVLRSRPTGWAWVYILAGVFAIEGEPFWGPLPVLLFEVGAIAVMTRVALRLPQIAARPLELPQRQ